MKPRITLLGLLMACLISEASLAACYHEGESIYLHGRRQAIDVGTRVDVAERPEGIMNVTVQTSLRFPDFRIAAFTHYANVQRDWFVLNGTAYALCDTSYFGGVWANREESIFDNAHVLVLPMRDADYHSVLMLAPTEVGVANIFLNAVERLPDGQFRATLDWQLVGERSNGRVIGEPLPDIPLNRQVVQVGDIVSIPKNLPLRIRSILPATTYRAPWVLLEAIEFVPR